MTTATFHRWNELPTDAPMDLVERRRIIGQHAMISHVRLKKGCYVPTHQHPNEQFAVVISGRIRFGIGEADEPGAIEDSVILEAGDVLEIPANAPHSAEALEDTLVLDVFSPPSETTGVDHAS